MKKNIRKIYIGLIVAIFLMATCIMSIGSFNTTVFAEEIKEITSQEQHIPTINDDFEDNKVIVTLKSEYSKINNKIDKQKFSTSLLNIKTKNADQTEKCGITIKSIEDLTYFSNLSILKKNFTFNQILSIELQEHNKQNVLDAIKELEKLDFVLAAEPSYNYGIEDDGYVPNDPYFAKQWG